MSGKSNIHGPQTAGSIPVPLLDVNRGNEPLLPEIMQKLEAICRSGQFIGGPHCKELESLVAGLCDVPHAIGCASGSDALLLSLMAIDIGPGDEVILPSFTFFATASAVTRLGATPVFVDIDPATYNMNVALIEGLVTSRTRAIIPVHLFGQCCDMDAIGQIAERHGLHVIEDACQSLGATFNGRMAGSLGSMGCISFYPTKNLGGFGDGGMVVCRDTRLAERIRLLANHGMQPRYYHQEVGINSRLDAMQAAVLASKVPHLDDYAAARAENARSYMQELQMAGLGDAIVAPGVDRRCGHVWNQFTVRIPAGMRDKVRAGLTERGIGSEIYYPVPLHRQKCFAGLCVDPKSLPETDKAAAEVLSLPVFPELTLRELRTVVGALAQMLGGTSGVRRAA